MAGGAIPDDRQGVSGRDSSSARRTLVGREEELAGLRDRLTRYRVVSVTGPGGVGKTSLAMAAVDPPPAPGPTRVVMCELAELEEGDAVRHSLASALQVVPRAGEPLGRSLPPPEHDERLLVLLDNCEHVLDPVAALVEELLAGGPHVSVLATSREPLAVDGEQVLVLEPLAVPASASDPGASTAPAVVLFARRAEAVGADLRLDEKSLPEVIRICRALDGVPLALEIAAARVRSLGVEELVSRLEKRFSLLRASTRRAPDRHRSMRAVVEWSYSLLGDDEQSMFLALSAFPGGCDLTAATAAGAALGLGEEAVVDIVDGLVAKSLMTATAEPGGTRYRMLETLREFGLELLERGNGLAAARNRQADHYAGLMGEMRTRGQRAWTPALSPVLREFDNVRAAATWTLAEDTEADRTFALLAPMWYASLQHNPGEVATLTDRALGRWPDASHPLWSDVAATSAQAKASLGDVAGARLRAEAAVSARSSAVGVALGLSALVTVGTDESDASVLSLIDRADEAAAAAGFEPLRCDLMGRRATALAQSGRVADALAAARQAFAMSRAHDNVYELAWSQHLIGLLLIATEPDAAEEWLRAALAASEDVGYPYGTSSSLRGLGVVSAVQGDLPTAAGYLSDALTRFIRAGHLGQRWTTVAASLPLLSAAGRREAAATLLVGVDHAGAPLQRIHAPLLEEVRADLADELGSPQVLARGQALGSDQLLTLALRELREIRDRVGARDRPTDAPGPGPATAPEDEPATTAELRRVGDLWQVHYAGSTVHVRDSKGMQDLAVLLARPGREVAALDLAAPPPAGLPAAGDRSATRVEDLHAPGHLGDQLDARARAAYTERIRVLQEELDEADATGDAERGARAQVELDMLTRELSGAYGLHGPRRAGDPSERARSAVTARIRATIARIREAHPGLGAHLAASVRTGRFCSYRPEPPMTWLVSR